MQGDPRQGTPRLGDARPVTHLPPERHAFLQEGGAARQVALVECQAPYRPEGLRLQVRSASAALAQKEVQPVARFGPVAMDMPEPLVSPVACKTGRSTAEGSIPLTEAW